VRDAADACKETDTVVRGEAQKWVYLFARARPRQREDARAPRRKGAGSRDDQRESSRARRLTITTAACNAYFKAGKKFPPGLWDQIERGLATVERATKRSSAIEGPLLVSVRIGRGDVDARMMDTVLNLGLNDQSRQGLASLTKNERFAWTRTAGHLHVRSHRSRHPAEKFDSVSRSASTRRARSRHRPRREDLAGLVDEFKGSSEGLEGRSRPSRTSSFASREAVFGRGSDSARRTIASSQDL